jgi:hypothetical protein
MNVVTNFVLFFMLKITSVTGVNLQVQSSVKGKVVPVLN